MLADSGSVRARAFLALGQLSALLPAFRGRTRIFLEIHRILGLRGDHILTRATLSRPIRFKAELDLHSWLQRVAFLTGGYEEDTVAFLLKLHQAVGAAGYLLDVGANIGLIAIPFALLTGEAALRVVAIEAVSDNIRFLTKNISINNLSNHMIVVPYAVGERCKTEEIQVEGDLKAGEGTGTANILPNGSTYECVRQTVQIETLDHLMALGTMPPGCSVMKIDADGYDLKVLEGATRFLDSERPVIFGEFAAHCLAWHGQSLRNIGEFASDHGYEVWGRDLPGWRFLLNPPSPFVQDLLLVPIERRAIFQHLLM